MTSSPSFRRQKRPASSALDRIVRREAYKIRRSMPPRSIEFEELMGYGYIGLVEAESRFNGERGATIETFARYRIRGAMIDGVRHSLGVTRRRAYEQLRLRVSQSEDTGAEKLASDRPNTLSHSSPKPKSHEAATSTQRGTHDDALAFAYSVLATDAQLNQPPSPESLVSRSDSLNHLSEAMAQLSDDDQEILTAVYDLLDVDDSGAQLAARRGVHRSSISRRHKSILRKMRELMA